MSFTAVMFDGLGAAKRKREKKMATVRVSATVKCIGKGRRVAIGRHNGTKVAKFVSKKYKCGSKTTISAAKPFSSTFQPRKRRLSYKKARKGQAGWKLVLRTKA